jgi:hypothetical protein
MRSRGASGFRTPGARPGTPFSDSFFPIVPGFPDRLACAVKYAIGGLVLTAGVVLGICALTLDAGSLLMVGGAMVILTVCGTAPVALGVLARRRAERGRNTEREEIIRIRDGTAGPDGAEGDR